MFSIKLSTRCDGQSFVKDRTRDAHMFGGFHGFRSSNSFSEGIDVTLMSAAEK